MLDDGKGTPGNSAVDGKACSDPICELVVVDELDFDLDFDLDENDRVRLGLGVLSVISE